MALLGNLKGSAQVFQDTEFYNGIATQSLRFDDANSYVLSRTPSSSGNRQVWTVSFWIKRTKLAHGQGIASTYTGSPATANTQWSWESDDAFMFYDYHNSYQWRLKTNRLFRDVGSWYHIVLAVDTTQSTSSDRIKIYVNGEQETSFAAETYPSQNLNTADWNTTQTHYIGRHSTLYLDGYMAEFNNIDGLQLDPTYFGETKNGVWIAKEYTGAYGTNGFRLQFKETGVGTGASDTIGADTSGNGHHFTSTNVSAHDCAIPDSPENNFCTLNSVGRRYGQSYVATFTKGNLKFTSGGNATNVFGSMAINQIASQGGVYFELRFDSIDSVRTYFGVIGDSGVNNKNITTNSGGYTFPIKGMLSSVPRGYFTTDTDASNSEDLTANTAFGNGDVAGIAILSDGKFFVHRNGTYLNNEDGNTGNPSTGANPIATIDLTEGDWLPYLGYSSSYSANFGQDGTFSGQETSGGNSDANGIGDFMFAVPTNCLALCTSNMAEPTIGPNSATQADDHFNTVLYTGDGNNSRTVTGVGFQPDWLWIKRRDGDNSHVLVDSSRGSGSNDSLLSLLSNVSDAEYDLNDHVRSLDSDGFTLDDDTDNTVATNNNSQTYVAWNWKANGGTTSSNSDGTTTSTVQANTTAGFSILLYTGNATAGATIGHGLGKAPKWVITKARSGAYSWLVGHDELASDAWTDAVLLDTNGAVSDSNLFWNDTAPNSSVITLGGAYNPVNGNNVTYVMYAFAEIEGYSKFGSYIGNGNANGAFVYTGFRPALIIIKQTNSTNNWRIIDNKRDGYNGSTKVMFPSVSNAEGSEVGADLLSNGFKLRADTAGTNASGGTFIYMAFAEAPFKFSNAR